MVLCFIINRSEVAMHGRGGFSRSGPPAGEEAAREKAMRSIFGENSYYFTDFMSEVFERLIYVYM